MEQLAAEIRAVLAAKPGLDGRERARVLVEEALHNAAFVAATFGPERNKAYEVLHEDAELGFRICAHVDEGAVHEDAHDHGDCWVIYGQVEGTTDMTDWRIVQPASADAPATMALIRTYQLRPGMAHYYEIGAVHASSRAGRTKLLRVEGKDT